MPDTAVIGIGNLYRRDDAAGLLVVKRVREMLSDSILTFQSKGDMTELLDAFSRFQRVYVVDALAVGSSQPGTVFRIDGDAVLLPVFHARNSTHAFGLAEAVEMARTLGVLPEKLVIVGINGRHFDVGRGICSEVHDAVNRVAKEIVRELRDQVREREGEDA